MDFTLLEKGGLNDITLDFLFLILFHLKISGRIYSNSSSKRLSFESSLYVLIGSSNISSSDGVSDIRFTVDFGNYLRMLGGWAECIFI